MGIQQRAGAASSNNSNLPGILKHPLMQKFGAIEHQELETKMMWLTPTVVPFMHLAIDDKDEKWGLFARDEMALLVGATIFLATNIATHKLFNHLGWFTGSRLQQDKGNFFAYAIAHAAALLHGGFTAMWFGRWADKIFVHPDDPTMPISQRVEQSVLKSKPAQWLRQAGMNLPQPTPIPSPLKPAPASNTKIPEKSKSAQPEQPSQPEPTNNIVPFKQTLPTAINTQQRSGQALNNVSFGSKWRQNFKANFGENGWAVAQKFSGCFIAVPILPALRWNQYVTKDQHLDPEEAHRKRLELATRDASALFGGNVLYLSIWVTTLSILEHRYPQISLNYRQNIASVFGDLAKTLNAGIFAVVFSKWLTARKEKKRLLKEAGHQEKIAPTVAMQKDEAVKKNSPIPTEDRYLSNKRKDHFSSAKHLHA